MLVRRREYGKKAKETNEGWPPTARAITILPETLPRNRSCNGIAVSANTVAMSCEAKKMARLLTRKPGAGHSRMATTSYSTAGLVSTTSDRIIVMGRNLGRDGDIRTMC